MNESAAEHIAQSILVLRRKRLDANSETSAKLELAAQLLQCLIGRIEALEKEARP